MGSKVPSQPVEPQPQQPRAQADPTEANLIITTQSTHADDPHLNEHE